MGIIYRITNKTNGKSYIGQTINSIQYRVQQHKCADSYLGRALRKYGIENFDIEILESGIPTEDLDAKEQYYIQKYKTYRIGYNLTIGGDGTRSVSEETVRKIIHDLEHTKLTEKQIGDKYGLSMYGVSSINTGETHHNPEMTYPIRTRKCTAIYTEKQIRECIELLRNTNMPFQEIADRLHVKYSFVADVNKGKRSTIKRENLDFPIRKYRDSPNVTPDILDTVIQMLKTTSLSTAQIADQLGLPSYTVGQINRGKLALCKTTSETYPIRKTPHRNKESARQICAKLSEADIAEIVDMLINTQLRPEEIAQRYGIHKTAIERINRGQTWSNLTENLKKPIRQNQKHNRQIMVLKV